MGQDRSFALLLGTASALAAAAVAGAQQTSTPADQSDQSAPLQEIIITAEKRSESLERTPISVTALSGSHLAEEAKNTILDMLNVVPSVRLEQNPVGGNTPDIFLRGIGPSLGTDPAVSYNVDGIYQANTAAVTFDIDRVEVLRGPQGTLYGRNTPAGTVNIITNNPTDAFAASGSLQVGNYQGIRTEAMINAPLAPGLDVRIAALQERHVGYFSNGTADEDTTAARLKLLYKPNDDLSILLTGSYAHFGGKAGGVTFPPLSSHASNPWLSDPTDLPGGQDSHKIDVYGQLDWSLGWAVLTFLPSYYYDYQYSTVDPLGVVAQPLTGGLTVFKQNTQELRLSSPLSSKIAWVVGLYRLANETQPQFAPPQAAGGPPLCQAYQPDPPCTGSQQMAPYVTAGGSAESEAASDAIFGQVTYPVRDNLRVTGGLRYTEDKKTVHAHAWDVTVGNDNTISATPNNTFAAFETTNRWHAFNYLARIEYDLTPTSLLYGSVSSGYKAGGLNDPVRNAANNGFDAGPTFLPEKLTDYEFGSKNRLFDGKLLANAAFYYYDYNNIQEFIIGPGPNFGPPSPLVENAAKAKVYGVDADAAWSVTRSDQVTASVDYNHTRFGTFLYPSIFYGSPNNGFVLNRTGETLPDAPLWSGSVGLEHVFRLGGQGSFTLGGQMRYYGSFTASVEPADNAPQGSYHQSDAHLTYNSANDKWSVTGFVNNIENKAVVLFIMNVPPAGVFRDSLGPPRVFGVNMKAHF